VGSEKCNMEQTIRRKKEPMKIHGVKEVEFH
jgi:hypothetical protein